MCVGGRIRPLPKEADHDIENDSIDDARHINRDLRFSTVGRDAILGPQSFRHIPLRARLCGEGIGVYYSDGLATKPHQ